MALPLYTALDFAEGLLRLMPTGRAWSRDQDSVFAQTIRSQGSSFARLHARSNYLPTDAFPATTVELLPEWEASLGLPDPCAGPDPTIAQRQAHVVARLTQSNGPSIPSLTAFAATLGYTITITEFAPARADVSCADDPCYEPEWAFIWQINAPSLTIDYACADTAFADDLLLSAGNTVLQCELQRLAPAHTIVQFNYTDSEPATVWDSFTWDDGSVWQ